jgi:uncharacterized protein YqkB
MVADCQLSFVIVSNSSRESIRMTPDQRILASWGAGLAGAVIVGWILLDLIRGPVLTEQTTLAENLGKNYQELYPAEGMAIEEATATWKRLRDHQKAALENAETSMVPALPKDYQDEDLSSGGARVNTDLKYLKQKAQRQNVQLPATLPFEEGLNENPKQRLMQLAQLYLYRHLIDTCMEAGVTKINSVKVASGPCDPQRKYALMLCTIELDVTWERTSQLLADLNQAQTRNGFGLRGLTIEHLPSGGEKVNVVVSLITANNPAWNLNPDSAPTSLPSGSGNTPASNSGGASSPNKGSRFGGADQ